MRSIPVLLLELTFFELKPCHFIFSNATYDFYSVNKKRIETEWIQRLTVLFLYNEKNNLSMSYHYETMFSIEIEYVTFSYPQSAYKQINDSFGMIPVKN